MSPRPSLLSIKSWYTLQDVTRRLRIEFDEDIQLADILQLIMEGQIKPALDASWLVGVPLVSVEEHRAGNSDETVNRDIFSPMRLINPSPVPGFRLDCDAFFMLEGKYYLHFGHTTASELTSISPYWDGDGEALIDRNDWEVDRWYLTEIDDPDKRYAVCEYVDEFDESDQPDLKLVRQVPLPEEWLVMRHDLEEFIGRVLSSQVMVSPCDNPLATVPESSSASEVDVLDKEAVRVLEVLGLAAITIKEKFPSLYAKANGEPNFKQIAEEMVRHVPQGVRKMGHSKISRLLSDGYACYQSNVEKGMK